MKRFFIIIPVCILALVAAGCARTARQERPASDPAAETGAAAPQMPETAGIAGSAADLRETGAVTQTEEAEETNVELQMLIDGVPVAGSWEDNEAVSALQALCKDAPLTIPMSMYGGFEQVGPIGSRLPADDRQITTEAGDIVLYAGDRLVVFYGPNTWAYTRLGRITDKTAAETADLLGGGSVTVTITYGGR